MGSLQFDGVDDRLEWTTLAAALANVSDGAWTMAALVKRSALLPGPAFGAVGYLTTDPNPSRAGFSFSFAEIGVVDVGVGSTFTSVLDSLTSPYLVVVSKAAGAVAPRLGWKLGSGGAWTHENGDTALADALAANSVEIGSWQGQDFLPGWVGVVAFWEGAMSDANKEALDDNWRTSDWWNSAHGTPAFLAELNVAGSSVVDLAENASSLTATGTTLDSGETLNDWNFNGKGAVASGKIFQRIARPRPFAPGLAR